MCVCVSFFSVFFFKLSSVLPGDLSFPSRSVLSAGPRHSEQSIPYRRGKSWLKASPSGDSSKHSYHGHKLDPVRIVCVRGVVGQVQ